MKDITFDISHAGGSTKTIVTSYGGKPILRCNIWDTDVAEFKALAMAVQLEMAKDCINTINAANNAKP